MSKIRTATVLTILAVVLVVPSVAQANSEWHFTGGEVGYTSFPDHVKSTKTRAEVLRELEQAKADNPSPCAAGSRFSSCCFCQSNSVGRQ